MAESSRKVIVYAAGVWDMFHVGHLNLLKKAKALGDILIVGVSTDDLVLKYKGHHPLMCYEDRAAVVENCKFVDAVVPQRTIEKDEQLQKLDVDILVVGDDWWDRKVRGHDFMISQGRRVVYFPYTEGRSTTRLRQALERYYAEQIELNGRKAKRRKAARPSAKKRKTRK
jgi:rfaE bifunctional protein nucleotidyltransferase chain/domain